MPQGSSQAEVQGQCGCHVPKTQVTPLLSSVCASDVTSTWLYVKLGQPRTLPLGHERKAYDLDPACQPAWMDGGGAVSSVSLGAAAGTLTACWSRCSSFPIEGTRVGPPQCRDPSSVGARLSVRVSTCVREHV